MKLKLTITLSLISAVFFYGAFLTNAGNQSLTICAELNRMMTVSAQTVTLDPPTIAGVAKGPNQINLTWSAVNNPGYGYTVEVQSSGDGRYAAFTEIAGPSQPYYKRLPTWVTESHYKDPQDDSAAQFIAASLKPNTTYNFRVRTYSGYSATSYSGYSNQISVTTANYPVRYVCTTGNDGNGGTNNTTDCWRTIGKATSSWLTAGGRAAVVMGGTYAEGVVLDASGSAGNKIVLMANPGDSVILTGTAHGVEVFGNYSVVDGLVSRTAPSSNILALEGDRNAIFNTELNGLNSPSTAWSPQVRGGHNLLQGIYSHDIGVITDNQTGSAMNLYGTGAVYNYVQYSHFSRGAHDTGGNEVGSSYNAWLNNLHDGGWGYGWGAVAYDPAAPSGHNLVEGSWMDRTMTQYSFYKPGVQFSGPSNTFRRNLVTNCGSKAIEISGLHGVPANNNLIYNNVFYNCSGEAVTYATSTGIGDEGNNIFANNIFYALGGDAEKGGSGYQNYLYLQITGPHAGDRWLNNNILFKNASVSGGAELQGQTIICVDCPGGYASGYINVSQANTSKPGEFSNNTTYTPGFVSLNTTLAADFHLAPGSALLGRAAIITDTLWGTITNNTDVGAYKNYNSGGVTPAPTPTPTPVPTLTISAVQVSSITSSGATVAWTTSTASDTQADYGLTTSYGSLTTLNAAAVTSHTATLSGLTAGTLYHYRARSRDAAGTLATSADFTFTTAAAAPAPDTTPPTISSVASSGVSSTVASISWLTNENSDSQVEFGPSTTYGLTSPLNTTLFTNHLVTLTGLVPSTTYHYRVKSRDAAGNLATSGDFIFTTTAASSGSAQYVTWTNLYKATVSGTTLQKTSGCDGCESTGQSQQMISSGNGYLEFTASETTTDRAVGLMRTGKSVTVSYIDYAIILGGNGNVSVRERGIYRTDTVYRTGDVFRVAIENGAVKYYKNGVVFYQSKVVPTYPLVVGASMINLNATVTNAKVAF